MPKSLQPSPISNLRLTSSGSKVFIQLMMFLVTGALPLVFPQWIHIENRLIIFIDVSIALVFSIVIEFIRIYLEKKSKYTTLLLNFELVFDVVLLAVFLHYFGHINGPFYVLYLITVMESFLL